MRSKELSKLIWVLDKSRKEQAFCIAGKDVCSNEWVRLVSDESGCALTAEQAKVHYSGASVKEPWDVKVNDLVRVNFKGASPINGQAENWVIAEYVWTLCNHLKGKVCVERFFDFPESIWGEGGRISDDDVDLQQNSLYLINVKDFQIYHLDSSLNGKRKVKSSFVFNNIIYSNISVTDPNYYYADDQFLGDVSLVVSLGQEYDGYHYKIVAKIFKDGEIR